MNSKYVVVGVIAVSGWLPLTSSATPLTDQTVERYTYGKTLDIAHVVSVSDIADVCGIVTKTMTYEDSRGQRHVLEYKVWGSGCD
jgi:hypothetical protein